MFEKRKMAKRLAKIGSCVDMSFLLYINNEEPISFPTYANCVAYLKEFRENNVISKLQIFRIETYSL